MTKAKHIIWFGRACLVHYALVGYVAVRHLGWLDGLAAVSVLSLVVGAIRTKTTWDEIVAADPNGGNDG